MKKKDLVRQLDFYEKSITESETFESLYFKIKSLSAFLRMHNPSAEQLIEYLDSSFPQNPRESGYLELEGAIKVTQFAIYSYEEILSRKKRNALRALIGIREYIDENGPDPKLKQMPIWV